MKNALAKDTIREIKKSFGRFLSIFAIVAIGVAFFAGVKAAAPDMKYTADKYYDDYNLFDLRILTTMGLTKEDTDAIEKIDGVKGIYKAHSMDALTRVNNREVVLKIHGLPIDNLSDNNENYINRPKIIEGRLPKESGECLIEKGKLDDLGLNVGSKITLESGKETDILDSLKTKEFTIVGTAQTPYYLSFEKGASDIGSGSINNFIMIPEEDFNMDYYTEVFVTIDGAKELNSYNDEYFEVTDKVKNSITSLGNERAPLRIDEIRQEALKELQKGKDEYEENKLKFEKEIKDAEETIEKSERELLNGELELKVQESNMPTTLAMAKAKIEEGENKLKLGEEEYNKNLNLYNEQKESAEKTISALDKSINDLRNTNKSVAEIVLELASTLGNFDIGNFGAITKIPSTIDREKLADLLEESRNTIENKLVDGKNQLDSAKVTIESSKKELEIQKANLEKGEIYGKAELEAGKAKIEKGREELQKGKDELKRSKELGLEQLEEAKEKLDNAENQINEIKEPEWIILDRNSHYSYVDYGNAADRIEAIAKVFPLFFFLVSALVCLTTMTRMVDEQRSTIGALKALGYSKGAIASKYIAYAATASLGGAILGLSIGMVLFPIVIFDAWGIMYTLPPVELRFDPYLAIGSTLIVVLITTFAAVFACYKELVETPSLLMRPRAPKEGKRIFLERITFLWKRLSFTEKVTARNIFRYKKRFFMTVIGIAGCTALLLAGFGIKDSIKTIAYKQFGEILKYDSFIDLDTSKDLKDREDILLKYSSDSRVEDIMKVSKYNGNVFSEKEDKRVSLIVPSDISKFKDFTSFRDRKSGDEISLKDDGALINEKLSKELKVKVGDTISLDNGDGEKKSVKISGIIEMYVDNYVYMSDSLYKETFGVRPELNSLVMKVNDKSDDTEEVLGADLMNEDAVKSVSFYSGVVENFENTISSLNYVIVVLVISAGALAFVVLYNLTNVNISERLRELATIKVLGFYDKEVSAYVYRENIILTLIGSFVGLALGTLLHRFIMVTVEFQGVMFGRNINILSYLYAIAITMIFAILVNLVMYYKLKNVQMVESLKSVE